MTTALPKSSYIFLPIASDKVKPKPVPRAVKPMAEAPRLEPVTRFEGEGQGQGGKRTQNFRQSVLGGSKRIALLRAQSRALPRKNFDFSNLKTSTSLKERNNGKRNKDNII